MGWPRRQISSSLSISQRRRLLKNRWLPSPLGRRGPWAFFFLEGSWAGRGSAGGGGGGRLAPGGVVGALRPGDGPLLLQIDQRVQQVAAAVLQGLLGLGVADVGLLLQALYQFQCDFHINGSFPGTLFWFTRFSVPRPG